MEKEIRDHVFTSGQAALNYLQKNLFEKKAINTTTNFEHIKRHYYYSHESINPYRIIPQGIGSLLE